MGNLNSRGSVWQDPEADHTYFDPQTVYDATHTWQNAQDRVAWQRALAQGTPEELKMAQALLYSDPGTPNNLIANTMTAFRLPPRFGYDRTEPGIMEVVELSGDDNTGHAGDMEMTDFSGQPQSFDGKGTEIPSLPLW